MKLSLTMKTKATADEVWQLFAHQFDYADHWMAAAPKSYSNGEGKLFDGAKSSGRIIEMKPDGSGMKASERFIAYDEAAKTCIVRVDILNVSAAFPIKYNSLDFSVVQDSDGGSTIRWIYGAKIKPWAYVMWPMLRMGMFKAWKELSEEFKHYVETGKPHPRKIEAIEKAKVALGA